MKKLEKLEKYVIIPNTRFYGGYVFDGEDINLCDDTFTDYDKIKNENGELEEKEVVNINVKQKIINSVLITDLTSKKIMRNGKIITEKSHMEIELSENELLVYVEGQGFVIPEYKMLKIDEEIERYNLLKSPINEEQ